ncbi:DUF1254 domain-containing protein [Gottfriedia acidiceleris]|uniref:DUF1254 domain-containing protein n=1 Tax=Gottfriedia acidiceleris TaxID=371036 RepID=UPI00112187FB|nr:DUF1214 domain-containing protein [Gottfriedia acidiceleris]
MQGRYYKFQILDNCADTFANIDTRTIGTEKGECAIVGPDWKADVPDVDITIHSRTNTVWIIGRTLLHGERDISNVIALQSEYKLTSLESNQALVDASLPVITDTHLKDPLLYFDIMTQAMKLNPPATEELGLVEQFKHIGIDMEKGFQQDQLKAEIIAGLNRAVKDAQEILLSSSVQATGTGVNGWNINYDLGAYGRNYLMRSIVALIGLASNFSEESLFPIAFLDNESKPLHGSNDYVIHFERGQTPAVNGFWSLTMYGTDSYLVENEINRYSISDRTEGLKYNEDGSLELYIQHARPLDRESNWLPAPADGFILILRLYSAKPEMLEKMLDGNYKLPLIQRTTK